MLKSLTFIYKSNESPIIALAISVTQCEAIYKRISLSFHTFGESEVDESRPIHVNWDDLFAIPWPSVIGESMICSVFKLRRSDPQ